MRLTGLLARPDVRTLLFFVVVIPLAADFILHYGVFRMHSPTVDFPSFYYGAKAAFQMHQIPYAPGVWKVFQKSYTVATLFPYIYPPPSLLFFYPLSWLDYASANIVMLMLNQLLILAFLALFLFGIMELRPSSLLALALAAYPFWFFPLVSTIKTGQVNLVILMSICLTWFAMKRRLGPLWIAIPLAIGTLLKLYPIVLVPILLLRKEYKALIALALMLLIASVFATWVLPSGIWGEWYRHVASSGYSSTVRSMQVGSGGNQSINGFLTRLFFGGPHRLQALLPAPSLVTHFAPYLAAGSVLLVSLGATDLANQNSSNESLDLQFSLWSLVLFLVAPLSWDHLLVLVLPCLYLAAQRAYVQRSIPLAAFVVIAAGLLAWQYPYNDPSWNQGPATLLNSVKFFVVVALWVYYAVLTLRVSQRAKSAASEGETAAEPNLSISQP